jgi:hypothetical protein
MNPYNLTSSFLANVPLRYTSTTYHPKEKKQLNSMQIIQLLVKTLFILIPFVLTNKCYYIVWLQMVFWYSKYNHITILEDTDVNIHLEILSIIKKTMSMINVHRCDKTTVPIIKILVMVEIVIVQLVPFHTTTTSVDL